MTPEEREADTLPAPSDDDVFSAPPEARIRLTARDYLPADCPEWDEERREREAEIAEELRAERWAEWHERSW